MRCMVQGAPTAWVTAAPTPPTLVAMTSRCISSSSTCRPPTCTMSSTSASLARMLSSGSICPFTR